MPAEQSDPMTRAAGDRLGRGAPPDPADRPATSGLGHLAPFRVEIHHEGEAARVVPVGELDLATAGELAVRLQEVRAAAVAQVVLDLRELAFIDSTGIRLILAEDRDARGNGDGFAVIGGPPAVQRVFDVIGLADRLSFRTA